MHHPSGAAQPGRPRPNPGPAVRRRRERRLLSLRTHGAGANAGRTSVLYSSLACSSSLVGRSTLLAQPLALPYGVKIEAARVDPSGGLVDTPLLPRSVQFP